MVSIHLTSPDEPCAMTEFCGSFLHRNKPVFISVGNTLSCADVVVTNGVEILRVSKFVQGTFSALVEFRGSLGGART